MTPPYFFSMDILFFKRWNWLFLR